MLSDTADHNTFKQDQEIWAIEQDHWTMPVLVHHADADIMEVSLPSMPMLRAQERALRGFLDFLAFGQTADHWLISATALATAAHRTLDDVEDVVRWWPSSAVDLPQNQQVCAMKRFYTNLSRAGIGRNTTAAEVLFRMVCGHMLEWLERGHTLDLLFCEIHRLPFRANWRQMIQRADMKQNPKTANTKPFFTEPIDITARHPEHHFDGKVLAMQNNGSVQWTLDIMESAWWRRRSAKLEADFIGGTGPKGHRYSKRILTLLRRYCSIGTVLYRDFLPQAAKPYGFMVASHRGGPTKSINSFWLDPSSSFPDSIRFYAGNGNRSQHPRVQINMEAAFKGLLELSHIQQDGQDMRKRDRLEELHERKRRKSRLWVLGTHEGAGSTG